MTKSDKLTLTLLVLGLAGCVSPPQEQDQEQEQEQRISHTFTISPTHRCGYLLTFINDVNQLGRTQQQLLLIQLAPVATQNPSSCDALKTGLVLSQTAETIEQDDQAITILQSFVDGVHLTTHEQNLVLLLNQQVKQRRRLHILVSEVELQLVSEQSSSKTMSSHLLELQNKLDLLLQIEDEINETEQSITPPSTGEITSQQ